MSVNSKMTAIADAIRAKTGGTSALTLDQMAIDIANIDTSGGIETCTVTISSNTVVPRGVYFLNPNGWNEVTVKNSLTFTVVKNTFIYMPSTSGNRTYTGDVESVYADSETTGSLLLFVSGDCTLHFIDEPS